ncbi:hypothetical protein BsWGS_16228 [Bradybaena similaris]
MALARDLLVILVLGVAGPRHADADPVCPYNTKSCYCFSQSMVCTDLQELPPLATGSNILNVTDLTFQDGNIRTISGNNSLPPNLITVSFTSHPLTNISIDAFQGSSTTLKHLTISHAQFTRLPAALVKLRDLNHFNMDHTYIQDWDTATFENSTATLTNLALVSVGLTEWPTWFSLFRSLQVVDVSNNSLKTIPDNAFSFVTNTLLHLSLTDCNLTQVPKTLSQLKNLTSLDLSGNTLTNINGRPAIEQIGMFPLAKTLVILQIKNSGLKVIPNFANLTKLSRINLDYNQITNSTSGSFSKSVTSLDLGENNLPAVPTVVAGMNNLTFLDLSYNNIRSVNFDTLPLPLDMVDLSGNNLTQINDTTTKELAELTYLYLYKNHITSIPYLKAWRRSAHWIWNQ